MITVCILILMDYSYYYLNSYKLEDFKTDLYIYIYICIAENYT